MSLREAAQQALEALESVYPYTDSLICYASTTGEHPPNAIDGNVRDAINALRTALAEPEQEPVAIPKGWIPLRIEWEPGYPEDVAFGPPYLMNRLKKWLDKHFANLTAPQRTEPEQDDTALLRKALEALEFESSGYCGGEQTEKALTALRERLGEKK